MKPILWLCVSIVVLAACNKTSAQDVGSSQNSAQAATVTDGQVLAVQVGEDGFSPNQVQVRRGSKATLRFTRTTDKTCATAVVFPDLGINQPLPLNQAVDITVPSDQARTLTFQCGMGMYQSKVVVL
jgi:plastocyanin domain-containing protein